MEARGGITAKAPLGVMEDFLEEGTARLTMEYHQEAASCLHWAQDLQTRSKASDGGAVGREGSFSICEGGMVHA